MDIWSFGIFVLELADGEPPYMGKSQAKILLKIVQKDAPTLKGDKWSPLFRDFVGRCLNKDPEQRASADECLQHEFLKDADRHKEKFLQYVSNFRQQPIGDEEKDPALLGSNKRQMTIIDEVPDEYTKSVIE